MTQRFKIHFDGEFTVRSWTEKDAYDKAIVILSKLQKSIYDKTNIYIEHTLTAEEEEEIRSENEITKKV
jgi:hypothetical protein